ncbi:hypothetical protein VI817_007627 [Penicillium citrinum]|nr:hypothetical protein VI817_007627 [Penicillium citrinum]
MTEAGSETPAVLFKSAEDSSELLQSLDDLLEQYLHLLDRQQRLQSGLAKELSSGFMALAHANYTCPPGRRYGADYYDERMKATRKLSIRNGQDKEVDENKDSEKTAKVQSQSPETQFEFLLQDISDCTSKDELQEAAEKENATSSTPEHPAAEAPSSQNNDGDAKESNTEEDNDETKTKKDSSSSKKKFYSDDPIHWYGILVPASLRNAQRSFTAGVKNQVPELASVIVEMQSLEQRITKLRSQLGVESSEKALK